MSDDLECLVPDWPAPESVRALTTTRAGGFSTGPYSALNLAYHVGDDPAMVAGNRALLVDQVSVPSTPLWLDQVHGAVVVTDAERECVAADARVSMTVNSVCAVLTADCLPVLLCDLAGTRVAIAHAGWRGLAAGVLERTIEALDISPDELIVWLGPAIGPNTFEVGEEVFDALVAAHPEAARAFVSLDHEHYLADLVQLARVRLQATGVSNITGGKWCTVSDEDRFFSYRRDGTTGRMASLIWLAE